jgi:hypothetical protein
MDQTGYKRKGYIYAGGMQIATQDIWNPGDGSQVTWENQSREIKAGVRPAILRFLTPSKRCKHHHISGETPRIQLSARDAKSLQARWIDGSGPRQ